MKPTQTYAVQPGHVVQTHSGRVGTGSLLELTDEEAQALGDAVALADSKVDNGPYIDATATQA